jgi:hypothetical protein
LRGWVLAAAVAFVACDDVGEHIYTGHLYEPTGACLDPSTAIDIVSGPAVGDACTPVCLMGNATASPPIYISTVCSPYPASYTTESINDVDASLDASSDINNADPCVPAFIAYVQNITCGVTPGDGGGDDGGGGSDGATDATPDAGSDATMPTDGSADAPQG